MNITKRTRLAIGAVGVCGAVGLAAGGAFTGTGLTTTGQANATQFVGGTITQTITGAILTTITYGFSDNPGHTHADSIVLTFSSTEDARTVSVALTATSDTGTWSCTNTASNSSTCTVTGGFATGVSSLNVTVA